MQTITPFLWFDDNAEEAMNFYTSIFEGSKVGELMRYGDAGPGPAGSVLGGSFELLGKEFKFVNGGPHYSFTPAVSLFVSCETQEEVDDLWEKLTEGGKEDRCGWLTDRFGLSWQIVPDALGELLGDPDPARAQRVMEAMLKMTKLDIQTLRDA